MTIVSWPIKFTYCQQNSLNGSLNIYTRTETSNIDLVVGLMLTTRRGRKFESISYSKYGNSPTTKLISYF